MERASFQRTFFVLVGIFFLNGVVWRGGKLLIALSALDLGASALMVGALAALYAFFPMLLSVHVGRLTDGIGSRGPILAGAGAALLAMAVPAVLMSFTTLFLSTATLGVAQLLVQVSVHNAVGATSLPERRSRNYSMLQVGASTAGLLGPLLVGVAIDLLGLEVGFSLVAIGAAAIAGTATMLPVGRGVAGDAERQKVKPRVADLLQHRGLRRTLFAGAVAMCGLDLFAFYLPVYGTAIGLPATVIGGVLATQAAAALLVRLQMGLALRFISETTALTLALFSGALALAAIPLFSEPHFLFSMAFLFGLGMGVAAPLTQALTYNNSPPGRAGEALGLRISVNKAIQVVVPLAFGAMGTALGVAPVFWVTSAVLLLGGVTLTIDSKPCGPR